MNYKYSCYKNGMHLFIFFKYALIIGAKKLVSFEYVQSLIFIIRVLVTSSDWIPHWKFSLLLYIWLGCSGLPQIVDSAYFFFSSSVGKNLGGYVTFLINDWRPLECWDDRSLILHHKLWINGILLYLCSAKWESVLN